MKCERKTLNVKFKMRVKTGQGRLFENLDQKILQWHRFNVITSEKSNVGDSVCRYLPLNPKK